MWLLVIEFIEKCRTDFRKFSPEEISFPRSVSDVSKYYCVNRIYSKGTPIHARGALLFNYHIKEKNLTQKYSLIQNGEKIKYCYLKKPNPIYENVISFIQDFPKESRKRKKKSRVSQKRRIIYIGFINRNSL